MIRVDCPYCGLVAEFIDSKKVYRRKSGWIYYCRPCDASVNTHKGTNKPLGRLANAELRRWRAVAHRSFDPIWQTGRYRERRTAAYRWLARKMGLTEDETHIALFDVEQCQRVVEIMNIEREKYRGRDSKHSRC